MPTHYYPCWIASGGHVVLRRGPDCESPGQAAAIVREKLTRGYASMGMVVRVTDGRGEPMETYISPPSARKAIRHYLDIADAVERGEMTQDM